MERPDRPSTSPTNNSRIASAAPAIDEFALGQHEIEALVVRLVGDFGGLRRAIGDADRCHAPGGAQRREASVVMARAKADAMAAPVETGEGHEQQVGIE